jgi:tRNA pseudouridine38-40 synthase
VRRLRLLLEYDGSRFSGFQRQPGKRTVQGVLEARLSEVCGHPIQIVGAGRTDAGVHALGQVAHFDTEGRIPTERVAKAIHSGNIAGLVVRDADEVDEGFHARYSARQRVYQYLITRERPSPFDAGYVVYDPYQRVDAAERMREALPALLGRHDFAAFCAAGSDQKSTERTIHSAELETRGAVLRLELTADAFLRSMVRIIAGLLLEIGRGAREPDALGEALRSRRRDAAGITAPAEGLCRLRVEYPDGFPPREHETVWRGWWPRG